MIEATITGVEFVREALLRLQKVAGAPDEIARDIGIVVERRIDRNFAEQRAPQIGPDGPGGKGEAAMGQPWAPLSAMTIAERRKGRRGTGAVKILQDTGRLKLSIAQVVSGGAVTVGTGVEYGPKHQGGEDRVPARPFIGIDEEDRETITAVVVRHLEAAVR